MDRSNVLKLAESRELVYEVKESEKSQILKNKLKKIYQDLGKITSKFI